jgi:hypothetical protein
MMSDPEADGVTSDARYWFEGKRVVNLMRTTCFYGEDGELEVGECLDMKYLLCRGL